MAWISCVLGWLRRQLSPATRVSCREHQDDGTGDEAGGHPMLTSGPGPRGAEHVPEFTHANRTVTLERGENPLLSFLCEHGWISRGPRLTSVFDRP